MANRRPWAMWMLAFALAVAPSAASGQESAANRAGGNPLREPAPASHLDASEAALPPPLENSPALQFASAIQAEGPPAEVELLPKPSGPQWQGDQPAWIRRESAPERSVKPPPEALPDTFSGAPSATALSPESLSTQFAKPYPSAFKAQLSRESWLFRPFHLDAFAGTLLAAPPIRDRVDAGTGFYTGFRFGWDMSKHFGMETSFGFSKIANSYPHVPFKMGDEKLFLWDVSWLWYPWGDTRFRPYMIVGTGLADVNFNDDIYQTVHSTLFEFPWGGGFKYRLGNRLAFRFDVRDNVIYGAGNGLNLMHNASLTANIEWHFGGGPKRSYWPWNPGRSWW